MVHTEQQFAAIWASAKKKYAELSGEDIDNPALPHPSSVEEVESALDSQEQNFTAFREKRGRFFKILHGVCRPIELVGEITAGGASLAFPPSQLCFGAVLYLIGAANGISASYDAIEDLMDTLKDFLVRLTVYNREHLPDELREKLAEILTTLLELLGQSTKIIKKRTKDRFLKFGRNILLGKDEKLDTLVSKLARLTEGETRLAGAETLSESKKTGRRLDTVSSTLKDTSAEIKQNTVLLNESAQGIQQLSVGQDSFRQEVREGVNTTLAAVADLRAGIVDDADRRHKDLAKSLLKPSVNPVDAFTSLDKSRVSGTGDWIRSEDLFKSWINRAFPVLWLSGTPGSGKTYLSSNVISYLQIQYPQGIGEHTSIGFFFFKDNDPETRSFNQALCDMAYQISLNDKVYEKYITTTISERSDIRSLRSKWRKLFFDFFRHTKANSRVFLVMDGVDEAFENERKDFLELLADLDDLPRGPSGESRINILLVGRPHISDELEERVNESVPTIHINATKNGRDIVNYVQSSIKKSKVLRATKKKTQEQIVDSITSNAQGMFIWVDLMLRELSKKSRESSILESLHHAPRGLDKMLRHVLESFSSSLQDEDPDDLNTLLMWVTCAARPLTMGEIQVILQLRTEEGDEFLFLEGKLRKQWASFFILTREDGLTTADLQDHKGQYSSDEEDREDRNDVDEGLDDVENDTDFSSNTATTTVTFCHASIGDFFRDEKQGKVKASDDAAAIGVDYIEARSIILEKCLQLIVDPPSEEKLPDISRMRIYARREWRHHFEEASKCLDSIDSSRVRTIAKFLVKMLRDEDGTNAYWSSVKGHPFFTQEFVESFQIWFKHASFRESLDADNLKWVQEVSSNIAEVLFPMARMIAKRWLGGIKTKPQPSFAKIFKVLKLARKDTSPGIGETTVAQIMEVAKWANMEENALWHIRVGICLREYEFYDEAMEHFNTALELEPEHWQARQAIARLHELRGEWNKVLEVDKETEIVLEKLLAEDKERDELDAQYVTSEDMSYLCERIADCADEIAEYVQTVDYLKKAYKYMNRRHWVAVKAIMVLGDDDVQPDIQAAAKAQIDILRGSDEMIEDEDFTRLTEMIHGYKWIDCEFFEYISVAAEKCDELEWLQSRYRVAILSARKQLKPVIATALEVCLAELYLRTGEEQRAIRLWERVIDLGTKPGAMENVDIKFCKEYVAMDYGRFCLQQALNNASKPQLAATYVQKMRKLCMQKTRPTQDSAEVVISNHAALCLGIWYREQGQHDQAAKFFTPYFKDALVLLSDDDPTNDSTAYYDLSHAFIVAGEEENALATLRMIKPWKSPKDDDDEDESDIQSKPDDKEPRTSETPAQEPKTSSVNDEPAEQAGAEESTNDDESSGDEDTDESSGEDDTKEDTDNGAVSTNGASTEQKDPMKKAMEQYPRSEYKWGWGCDGPCQKSFPIMHNSNVCHMCLTDLCDDCLALIKTGAVGRKKICHPDHRWLHIVATDKELENNEMLVGEEVLTLDQFKDRLRKKWNL